ncbi:hypothetical protein M3661_25690 [Paenibacillus sp. MER 180]|nr:hypothetical protein [Paenibacillus sp. MER 180]MCM3293502.1 hypothetical protein [Paenibacillus sp. MER 180]
MRDSRRSVQTAAVLGGDGGETERQRIDPGGRSCVRGSGPGMERVMTIT